MVLFNLCPISKIAKSNKSLHPTVHCCPVAPSCVFLWFFSVLFLFLPVSSIYPAPVSSCCLHLSCSCFFLLLISFLLRFLSLTVYLFCSSFFLSLIYILLLFLSVTYTSISSCRLDISILLHNYIP